MPSKPKKAAAAARVLPSIPTEWIDQFVTGPMSTEAVNDVSVAFKKALIERAMGAELSHHLGYSPGAAKPADASNHRNGSSGKTVRTDDGPLFIEVPRDRDGSFEPVLIPKHARRSTGFDDKIIAMYARGMTMREVQGSLAERYGVEVSPEFISSVTDAVMDEIMAWQSRPLEPMYPVVFFDALRVKIRADGVVRNKAIYLALGVLPDGTRDILGLWIEGYGLLTIRPLSEMKSARTAATFSTRVLGSPSLGASVTMPQRCEVNTPAGLPNHAISGPPLIPPRLTMSGIGSAFDGTVQTAGS